MSRSINTAIVSGNLGKDPEIRAFGERSKASFSVAVNKSVKSASGEWEDKVSWINVSVWGSNAQMKMLEGLAKGSPVVCSGELEARKSDDGKVWTEIVCQVDGVFKGAPRGVKSRDEDIPF